MTRQTKLKLRRGFVKAPLSYSILAVDQVSKADLKVIIKTIVKVKTDQDAQKLVGIGSKWGYKPLAYQTDRVGVITYKGIEVALMYRRVTLTVLPLPEDPAPEGALENPDDVWVRFDLFGKSVRQQHKDIREELATFEDELRVNRMELFARDIVLANKDKHIKSLLTKSFKEALSDKMTYEHLKEALKDKKTLELVTTTITNNQKELAAQARKKKR